MVYLLAVMLILVGVYSYDYRGIIRGEKLYYIILCLFLISIAGFRYRLGIDAIEYSDYYAHANPINKLSLRDFINTRYAPGFVVLVSFCKTISSEFMLLQFVESAMVNCAVFYFFKSNTRHCYFGILLYFLYLYTDLNMEVMREAIAVSFFLVAWQFFRDSKWLIYYLLALFATLFHVSAFALLFLPVICLPVIRQIFVFGKRTWIIGTVILVVGFAIHHFLLEYLKFIVFTESMLDRVNEYAKSGVGGLETLNATGIITSIFRLVVYPCIAMYFINRKYNNNIHSDKGLEKTEILSLASIYIGLISFSVFIFSRYNNYLLFFSFLIMSDWIFSILDFKNKRLRLGFAKWMVIFLPLFVVNTYSVYFNKVNRTGTLKSYMKYFPYKSVFEKEKDNNREKLFHYQRR